MGGRLVSLSLWDLSTEQFVLAWQCMLSGRHFSGLRRAAFSYSASRRRRLPPADGAFVDAFARAAPNLETVGARFLYT